MVPILPTPIADVKSYLEKIGGMEAIQQLPDMSQAFVPFIESSMHEGKLYHALLGCMMQARINVRIGKVTENGAPLINAELLDEMLSPKPEREMRRMYTYELDKDRYSYYALMRSLLDPTYNPQSPLPKDEAAQMACAFLGLLNDWRVNPFVELKFPIMAEFGKLVTQFNASPFKDKTVALVGAVQHMDLDYLEAQKAEMGKPNPVRATAFAEELTRVELPSFLFKNTLDFYRESEFLDDDNCHTFEKADRVVDCNVSCSRPWQAQNIPRLCAALAKPDGIVMLDVARDGFDVNTAAISTTHQNWPFSTSNDYLTAILMFSETAFREAHARRAASRQASQAGEAPAR